MHHERALKTGKACWGRIDGCDRHGGCNVGCGGEISSIGVLLPRRRGCVRGRRNEMFAGKSSDGGESVGR